MAMSAETRRKVVFFVVALIVVAMVLASTGCSTTTGASDEEAGTPLDATFYPGAMNAVCATTDARLAALPTPPEAISTVDWAGEVARALQAETDALGAIDEPGALRASHRDFVSNTQEQTDAWTALSSALASQDAAGIDAARTEILELSGGRNVLAGELGALDCQERSIGS